MKAVILVGGEGTRLRPLTCNIPKPMVPIVNRPFLEHMIAYLKLHGITEIVLALGYLPKHIETFFGDGSNFGVSLTYSVEKAPLGTAGAVKNLQTLIDGPFVVFNGDVFTDLDLTEMIKLHRRHRSKATLFLTPVEDPTAFGVVETDGTGRVLRFTEKPKREEVRANTINGGCYVLEPEVLDEAPGGQFYMFERSLFPRLLEMGAPMYGFLSTGYWLDIGTPDRYIQLHHDLVSGAVNSPALTQGISRGAGCEIAPSANLVGPVVMGDGCKIGSDVHVEGPVVLGPGCSIEEGSSLHDTVLWQGARVGPHSTLRRCVLGNRASVGTRVSITDGAIIGDDVQIGDDNVLERGVAVWPGKSIPSNTLFFAKGRNR